MITRKTYMRLLACAGLIVMVIGLLMGSYGLGSVLTILGAGWALITGLTSLVIS